MPIYSVRKIATRISSILIICSLLSLGGCISGSTSSSTNSSTSGSASSDGSTSGSTTSYVTWSGSVNDTTIKDAASNDFAVDSATRGVVELAATINLTGLTVDSSANVVYGGVSIGYVTNITTVTGYQIATFDCNNGSAMTITVTATQWSYSCATGSGGSGGSLSSGAGSTGTGSGTSTGAGGAGSTTGTTTNTASFSINETGEINTTLTATSPYYVATGTELTLTETTKIWAFTWAQYGASFWAVDAANANLLKKGYAFSGYQLAPAGTSGLNHVDLPAGTWYVGVVPNQTITSTYTNQIYAEMSVVSLTGATEVSGVPVATGVVNPGGWQTMPFSIAAGDRAYIETEGAGGTFAVMTAAQANTFATTYANGAVNGTYAYINACGTNSGGAALEIECELQLPPGNYSLVYINTSSSPSGGAANIGFFQ